MVTPSKIRKDISEKGKNTDQIKTISGKVLNFTSKKEYE